jgi:hypothetical protein
LLEGDITTLRPQGGHGDSCSDDHHDDARGRSTQDGSVAAGVKQQLESDAQRAAGLRLLPERFMVIQQAMGLPSTRGMLAASLLQQFIENCKASGFVHEALRRHSIVGATVAPKAELSATG